MQFLIIIWVHALLWCCLKIPLLSLTLALPPISERTRCMSFNQSTTNIIRIQSYFLFKWTWSSDELLHFVTGNTLWQLREFRGNLFLPFGYSLCPQLPLNDDHWTKPERVNLKSPSIKITILTYRCRTFCSSLFPLRVFSPSIFVLLFLSFLMNLNSWFSCPDFLSVYGCQKQTVIQYCVYIHLKGRDFWTYSVCEQVFAWRPIICG